MGAPNPALEQFLKTIPLFSLIEPPEMMDILRLLRPVELAAGEVLFRQGEPGKAMWVLGKGVEVSVSTTPPGAKRPIAVAYGKEGEVVGEMALIDEGARSGTCVVVEGGHAHEILGQEFHALRSSYSSGAFKVLRRICTDLCARLRATNERIVPSGQLQVDTPPRPPGPKPPVEMLDGFEPFRALPNVVKLALAQKLQVFEFHELTALFAEGERGDGAWFLLEGEISVGRNGKTFATLHPGSMLGLISAIDEGRRSASCVTTGPAKLLKLDDRDFDALFASGHRFAFTIVDLVARQLVGHLRTANAMLPAVGQTQEGTVLPVPQVEKAELPKGAKAIDMLPLELELDVKEFEIRGELLG